MALFNILVDIAAKTASFDTGIKQVNEKLEAFGENVRRVFELLAVEQVADFVKETVALGDALLSAATKAGVAAEAFTQLSYAAKLNSVSTDTLASAFVRMNVALSNAGTGGKAQNEALTALGLTYKDLKKLAPEDQFAIIADRINKLGSASDKSRAEVTLFGKSGADLAPLFEKGAAGILEMRNEAASLGQSFSADQLKVFEEAHKSIDRLESSFSALALTMVSKVGPALSDTLDQISALVSGNPQIAANANLHDALHFLDVTQDDRASQDVGNQQLARARFAIETQKLLVDPTKLQNPIFDSLLQDKTKPPGFQPDLLQPFHTTLGKEQFGHGTVNPAVQGWLDDTYALTAEGGKASDEFNKTQAELKGALDDGAISLEDFQARMEAARNKFNDAINIEPFVVSLKKLPEILTEADNRSLTFIGDVQGAFLQASQATGAFGQNLLKSLLQAFENRAIFNAIDSIGQALKDALDVGGRTGGGGIFGSIISGIIGGSFGEGSIGASADATATDFIDSYNAGAYGGGKAGGGPLEMGKWYTAGEHGPEPIWGGGPGAFASGYGGGAPQVNVSYNVDARGASFDLIKALPGILKKHGEQVESTIITGLQRNKYKLG